MLPIQNMYFKTTITENLFLNKFILSTESNNLLKSKYLALYGCLFFID